MASKKKTGPATNESCMNNEELETIASRVKELREGKHWNQTELAKRIGVNRSQITRLESGETKSINFDQLVSLAKVFGVTTDYLLCVSDTPHAQFGMIDKLGLSETAARNLASGSVDRDIVNRLLENKEFGTLCFYIRIYLDDSVTDGYLGRNELLDFGANSLRQFIREHPDKKGDAAQTIQLLKSQKITADEVNTEKIGKSFQKILSDMRTEIREKKPTTPTMTHVTLEAIQTEIAGKAPSEVTPDDIADGVMAAIESKIELNPGSRRIIDAFVRWVMRTFGGKRRNSQRDQFEAYQEVTKQLEQQNKK